MGDNEKLRVDKGCAINVTEVVVEAVGMEVGMERAGVRSWFDELF